MEFSEQFLVDFRKFVEKFDELAADSYKGEKLDYLAKEFLEKHKKEAETLRYPKSSHKFPNCSWTETLDEDLDILASEGSEDVSERHKLLGELYRRACQACYLRVTYNKLRLDLEEDRNEALDLGRFALRYNANNFWVCYWYMITLGWKLDVTSNAKERTIVARVFCNAARRCIRMNPQDALAHNLLGRYYFNVASLSWFEKTVAKNLLGAKLEGTFQDAEREFKLAHELQNQWLPSCLWMARVLLAQKRPMIEIKDWIKRGLQLECFEPTSEIERRELVELDLKLKNSN